jgi:hypothetical protein
MKSIRTLPLLALLATAVHAIPTVQNPGFEADGTDVKGAAGYVRDGNRISGWTVAGGQDVARVPRGLAFYDNGSAEGDSVLALQNLAGVRQDLTGFVPDAVYRITLRACGRAADGVAYGHFGALRVSLNGTPLIERDEVPAVDPQGVHESPFTGFEALFRAGAGVYPLLLQQTHDADGISVLVDDIRIEPVTGAVDEEAVVLVNRAQVRGQSDPVRDVDPRQARWIWSPSDPPADRDAPVGPCFFRRSLQVEAPADLGAASVIFTADNHADVHVNGHYLGSANAFSSLYELSILPYLQPGTNAVCIEARNAGTDSNPAGLVALVLLRDGAGAVTQYIHTDREWRCAGEAPDSWLEPGFDDSDWSTAQELAPLGQGPWGEIGFLQWLVAPDFPAFRVPGYAEDMESLRQLFFLHYPRGGPAATLWDGWMSMASLWPATGEGDQEGNSRRERWRQVLLSRRIDPEGYVSTHQHHGLGHGEGWPFPTFAQAHGAGWQFATAHTAYPLRAPREVDDWELERAETQSRDRATGWILELTEPDASITTPEIDVDSFVAPFIRLEWHVQGLEDADRACVEWATAENGFTPEQRLYFRPPADGETWTFTDVPIHRSPGWDGRITRVRVRFGNRGPATVTLAGLITAVDTRHNVNNSNYLQGCTEYVRWTADIGFLQRNLERMRRVMDFALREFRVHEENCVYTPWIGHAGRAGWSWNEDGTKTIHRGQGIGCNYWDLLPFSGRDTLATIYLYDALRRMAQLEQDIAEHPEWNLPRPPAHLRAEALSQTADAVKDVGGQLLWNPETGRFPACVDLDGVRHDYGYTFVNCEAIFFGFATEEQATEILAWLNGDRSVDGDTSQGDDIYHFRFAARATTRRNTEWYNFVWSGPEGIPWGGQVQDGGAVLGFAFHDHMARLQTLGPDDAWAQLAQLLDWFRDVREAGGYRAYYAADPSRGTLQGGGPPGGLGMDHEFIESLLVPQVMLYGFLGFEPGVDGFRLAPRLPADWPELTVTRVHFHDLVLEITATADNRITIRSRGRQPDPLTLLLEGTDWTARGTGLGRGGMDQDERQGITRVPLALGDGRDLELSR